MKRRGWHEQLGCGTPERPGSGAGVRQLEGQNVARVVEEHNGLAHRLEAERLMLCAANDLFAKVGQFLCALCQEGAGGSEGRGGKKGGSETGDRASWSADACWMTTANSSAARAALGPRASLPRTGSSKRPRSNRTRSVLATARSTSDFVHRPVVPAGVV